MVKRLLSLATNHPITFVLGATLAWLVLLAASTGIALGALQAHGGEAAAALLGPVIGAAGVYLLLWRLGWLGASGITRPGHGQTWCLTL